MVVMTFATFALIYDNTSLYDRVMHALIFFALMYFLMVSVPNIKRLYEENSAAVDFFDNANGKALRDYVGNSILVIVLDSLVTKQDGNPFTGRGFSSPYFALQRTWSMYHVLATATLITIGGIFACCDRSRTPPPPPEQLERLNNGSLLSEQV